MSGIFYFVIQLSPFGMAASSTGSSRPREKNKLLRWLLWSHATYILITAVWPIVDIESFMAVTGPKRDVWLVKTVGALLIPVAATLYSFLIIDTDRRPAILLGSLTALSFTIIDIYYAVSDVIPDIYLADAGVELIFLVGWIVVASAYKSTRS